MIVPSSTPLQKNCIGLLLHGYGADETDMRPIAEQLGYVQHWELLRAPITETWGGCSWFPFSEVDDLASYDPPLLGATGKQLGEHLIQQYPHHDFVIGGFSQGAMMAMELSFYLPTRALLLFSTSLIAQQRWQVQMARWKADLRIFQSHGYQDDILSFAGAQALAALLPPHTFHLFEGGHGIPEAVLRAGYDWLREGAAR